MNKKSKILVLVLGIFAVLAIGCIMAINASSTSVLSISKAGIIDIELKTYTVDSNNNEVELNESYTVMSDVLSYIPKVTNNEKSGDCYIRLKVVLTYGDNEKSLTEADVKNLNKDFIYSADGYFYYKEILKDQEIAAFDGIKLNDEVLQNEDIEVEVEVEAIQAKNFVPDFTNLSNDGPWTGVSSDDIIKVKESTEID